jgi:4,5:9,10-diseco-3-hydroxy-5,9,17-trioxoandrosta-1(10),2-diene-4-oate hydrolase
VRNEYEKVKLRTIKRGKVMGSSPAFQRLLEKIGVPVERETVSTEGLTTHYLKAGVGHPLLLVHGGGAGAIQWGPIIIPLARQFQIIAPDVVGYGESDKSNAPYDRPYLAR